MSTRMENWIYSHLGEAFTVLALIVGNAVGYARLVFNSMHHARRLSILETTVTAHVTDIGAHRNADFERRLEHLSDTIDEIKSDVKTLLQKEGNHDKYSGMV